MAASANGVTPSPAHQPATQTRFSPVPAVFDGPIHPVATNHKAHSHQRSGA